MKFTNLIIDNFLSVNHLETRLDNRGLVLIQGKNKDSDAFESNGAGKSTIFSEAPCWCLFGETVRGKKGDSVVNREFKKNCRVLLGIDTGNSKYEVIRHRKHKDYKNNVLLFRNGKNITGKSDIETNKMIQELLDIDYMTFTNSILFGQGISKTFPGATDSEQKAILERMLQIDIFKTCQEVAKQKVNECQSGISILQQGVEGKVSIKKSLTLEIESLQEKELELQDSLLEIIDDLEKELGGYEKELEEVPSTDETQQEIDNIQTLVNHTNKKIDSYKSLEDSKEQLSTDIKVMQKQNDSYNSEIKTLEKQLKDIKEGKNIPKTCSQCGQKLPLEDTSHLESHLEDSIESNRKLIQDNSKDLAEFSSLLEGVQLKLKEKDELQKLKEEMQEEIHSLKAEISIQTNKKSSLQKLINRTAKQIEEQKRLIGTTYQDIIAEKIELVESLEKDIKVFNESIETETKYLENLQFWVNGFGNQGIKSVLLDSVTPYLNQRGNYYLSELTDNSIELEFTTQQQLKNGTNKDKFSVSITNENGDDDYKGNSGGEKKRIDIAINMALQDLMQSRSNKSIDLIVYDEVFESLDEVGSEAVIHLLQEKANTCGTVLVVTHNYDLKKLFTKSLVIQKHGGKTSIIEENI